MEIFNCSTQMSFSKSYSRRRRSFSPSVFIPSSGFSVATLKGYISALIKKIRKESISFVVTVLSAVKNIAVNHSRFILASVPVAAAFIAIPKTMAYYMTKETLTARPVSIEMDDEKSIEFFMNQLALKDGSYFDNEGNVLSADDSAIILPAAVKEPVKYQTYTVKAGESISTISKKFGLTNISTLIAVNNIENVRSLRSGQKISIPSYDGLIHTVRAGETVTGLSVKYKTTMEDILDVNDLATENLSVGQKLFIPGARLDSSVLQKAMGELFSKPIRIPYRLSSKFGKRADPFTGVPSNHKGIDMACAKGTAIYSALSGKVSFTGYSNIYGNYVIINHYDGYQTLYGHMDKITCKKGDSVTQNSKIGLVGNTGYSTGPHLHFSVYKNGNLIDPLTLIK